MSHVIAVRITDGEWAAFQGLMQSNKVTAQQLLRGIIIDALVEEGYDALRCRQSEGRKSAGEASEAGGTAAP